MNRPRLLDQFHAALDLKEGGLFGVIHAPLLRSLLVPRCAVGIGAREGTDRFRPPHMGCLPKISNALIGAERGADFAEKVSLCSAFENEKARATGAPSFVNSANKNDSSEEFVGEGRLGQPGK